jgi:type II secretory pathway pseudopilin PulG
VSRGLVSRRRPTRRNRRADGFALIDIIFVAGVIALLSLIAMPRLLVAQQSAGAASAIGSLRSINSGQLVFALTCAAGFYAPRLTVLGQPTPGSRDPFVSYNLGYADKVTRSNYIIQMSGVSFPGAPAACNGMAAGEGAQSFKSAADPSQPGNVRFFASNANGQIWTHNGTLFAVMPEIGPPPVGIPMK